MKMHGGFQMTATPPSFERVREEIARRNEGTKARDLSALSKIKDELGADFDHRAEVFFRDEDAFASVVEAHVAGMTTRAGGPASAASKSQRRSGLRRVRAIAHELADAGDAGWDTLARAIMSCRRRLGLSRRQMVIQYAARLRDYELGKHVPRDSAVPILESLAKDAGVDPSVLTQHVTCQRIQSSDQICRSTAENYGLMSLGWKLPILESSYTRDGQRKTALPDTCPLKRDLRDFYDYKTAAMPPAGLRRHKFGRWRKNPDGTYESAKIYAHVLSSFFGFLHTKLGVPVDEMTLPMVADTILLTEYDRFLRGRGNSGLSEFSIILAQIMVRASTHAPGFVRQQRHRFGPAIYGDMGYLRLHSVRAAYARVFSGCAEEVNARNVADALVCAIHDSDHVAAIPEGVHDRMRHEAWCDWHGRTLDDWASALTSDDHEDDEDDENDQARSLRRVQALIAEKTDGRPLNVIKILLDGLEERRSCYPDGHKDAQKIDYIMAVIAFEIGCLPLRTWTLRRVRVHPALVHEDARALLPSNVTPSLFPSDDGGFTYCEHRGYFKNRQALARRNVQYVRMHMASWAVPYLRRYLRNVRPNIQGAQRGNPYLFPGNSRDKPLAPGNIPDRIARYTGDIFGWRMRVHWMRHLVATDILTTHPDALHFVAEMLQDDLETVRKIYDHTRMEDVGAYAHRHQEDVMGSLNDPAGHDYGGSAGCKVIPFDS